MGAVSRWQTKACKMTKTDNKQNLVKKKKQLIGELNEKVRRHSSKGQSSLITVWRL